MFDQLIKNLRNYFGISRTEARGLVVLMLVILMMIFAPVFYRHWGKRGYNNYTQDAILLDSIITLLEKKGKEEPLFPESGEIIITSRFRFDPNEVDFRQMLTLGLDTIIARRIIKYRNSGGSFSYKRDLLDIYDFPESLYNMLDQYIDLPEKPLGKKVVAKTGSVLASMPVEEKSAEHPPPFNINEADTLQLMAVKGIGSVFSRRIVKYRELLGGYLSMDQLQEVYGLSGESLDNIMKAAYVDSLFSPVRIRINFAEWSDLVRHPYIDSELANRIIEVRSARGPYRHERDIQLVPGINDSLYLKVTSYFEF